MADHKDYAPDIQKYVQVVNEAAVKGIVRHCGIALHSRDASLVSAGDPEELKRVRKSFLKKKLSLVAADKELDADIKAVVDKMKGDRQKSRVTVYYLLAEHFDKLGMFVHEHTA